MTEFVTILTTAESAEQAQKLAQALVTEQLAACVQMVAVSSCYIWNGKVNNEPEQLLLIKTRRELFDDVEARIKALHPYDTPEIIMLPVEAGSAGYLDWIAKGTRKPVKPSPL